MKIIISLFILIISFVVSAQEPLTSLEDLKGIWVNNDDECDISIYDECEVITMYNHEQYSSIRFEEIYFIKKGLEDKKNISGKDAYTKDLKESSKYFITSYKGQTAHLDSYYKEWSDLRFRSNYFYEFNPRVTMVIFNLKDHYFHYIERLPKTALKMLYERCREDSIDYIKQYLGIDVRNIISGQSIIFDSLEVETNMYLIEGELITVLGEQNDFLKMEYEADDKKIISGLIKKEDVKGILK